MKSHQAKDKILDAAKTLFYKDGIHATGINTITDQAGVAKMSLYNNFPSKADLIEAYIESRNIEWQALYAIRLATAHTPLDKILAVFDAYRDHAESAVDNGFRGCGMLNAAAEFPAHSPERDAVKLLKEGIEQLLIEHLSELFSDSAQIQYIATMLSFLLEGSIARAGLECSSDKLILVRKMAEDLIQTQLQLTAK